VRRDRESRFTPQRNFRRNLQLQEQARDIRPLTHSTGHETQEKQTNIQLIPFFLILNLKMLTLVLPFLILVLCGLVFDFRCKARQEAAEREIEIITVRRLYRQAIMEAEEKRNQHMETVVELASAYIEIQELASRKQRSANHGGRRANAGRPKGSINRPKPAPEAST